MIRPRALYIRNLKKFFDTGGIIMTTTETKKIKIEDAGFSNKAYNALARMGLKNLGDVCEKTEEDLAQKRSLGTKTLNIIKEVLASYGLKLKDHAENHISNLKLDKRVYRMLIVAGIDTIPKLAGTTQYKFEDIGFGAAAIKTIKQKLKEKGVDCEKYKKQITIDSGLDELDVSARTYHALRNYRIITVRDIVRLSKSELMRIRNFGEKSANELDAELRKHGLQLKE